MSAEAPQPTDEQEQRPVDGDDTVDAAAPPVRRRPRLRITSMSIAPWLFVLPNMAIFGLFTIYPAIQMFNMSLYESRNGREFSWVGMDNFSRILTSQEFHAVALQTVIFTVCFVGLTTIGSTIGAVLLNDNFKGRGFFRAIVFLPSLLSAVVVGLLWRWILDRGNGMLNTALAALGLPQPGWLIEGDLAMGVIIFVGLWIHTGFYTLIMLAGLQGIDPTVYEAAKVDGATGVQRFFKITWPLLRPTTLVVTILSTISGFQAFDYIWNLTGGGPLGATTLIVQYIYEAGFDTPASYGLASAGGVILFVAVFIFTLINFLVGRRNDAA
ncbi:carbohydrate ABC transporter permease [Parenemella sanctibonifatiensis]|uniref:carbohydrate ABC transporter permease n=1 Tax=Parenemella sanctibonifatiensis TaxID=2016505 RepID=UPI001E516442|nr:sugar ABC transporter permease [Parenemella sanctibonifatiensis]